MKKIINGKLYNTETAKCVGYWENTPITTDYNYYYQELYLKRTGEYFLYTWNLVPYGYNDQDYIDPLSEYEAKEWVERCLDADDYIDMFGCPEE